MAAKLRETVRGVSSSACTASKAKGSAAAVGQKRGRSDEGSGSASASAAAAGAPPAAKAPVNKWAQKSDADDMAALAFGSNNKKAKVGGFWLGARYHHYTTATMLPLLCYHY